MRSIRPFKQLSIFRSCYPDVPITAVTATATDRVRQDILNVLGLPQPPRLKMFLLSTARWNLHYEVRFKTDKDDVLADFMEWLGGVYERRRLRLRTDERAEAVSGIIYCQKRQQCEDLARVLREKGVGAKAYHAGLTS